MYKLRLIFGVLPYSVTNNLDHLIESFQMEIANVPDRSENICFYWTTIIDGSLWIGLKSDPIDEQKIATL